MRFFSRFIVLVLVFVGVTFAAGNAQTVIQPSIDFTHLPAAAQPSAHFDADAATNAYMAMIPADATARSNAYFEGGYWLILWDFLMASAIYFLLLHFGWSARMRNLAERLTRFKTLQTVLYWIQYLPLIFVLGFPLEFYENFIREHKYGLSTQSFGPWMGDEIKALLVNLILGAVAVAVLFAIVRKLRKTWWIWGSLATVILMTIAIVIGPVFLQPIFNRPTQLTDPKIVAPILKMAHANGIPTNNVYEIDASRQNTHMSANVSGFAGTMRITLSDNLINRGSPQEIQAVMGHEMGHYVMNHIPKFLAFLLILAVTSFVYLRWGLTWTLARWGERWQIRDISDPAVLPLVMLLIGILFFVLTPVMNSYIRVQEKEADMYGLNAARQPDGFAQAAIHLSDFRKMNPTPMEEIIFFDHPSGYNRIHSAMVWKGQNLELFTTTPVATSVPLANLGNQKH